MNEQRTINDLSMAVTSSLESRDINYMQDALTRVRGVLALAETDNWSDMLLLRKEARLIRKEWCGD